MSTLMQEVDARTRLAGANQLELLLFGVGGEEVFGINVFKVREVLKRPVVTPVPEADPRLEGLANIRGFTVPVIDLRLVLNGDRSDRPDRQQGYLLVTEYNQSCQAFHVERVERIVRLAWTHVTPPPPMARETGKGMVTAVTMLEDGRMVLILDVETLLALLCPRPDEEVYGAVKPIPACAGMRVLFADDSATARLQIRKTLDRLGLPYVETRTGQEAWESLVRIAEQAAQAGRRVKEEIQAILTDLEMPELDGFTLTKLVRNDPRFDGIPVIVHSSLTGTCNEEKAKAVGATDYVVKFDSTVLAETLLRHVTPGSGGRGAK
jgi:two-component system chemotaxis response regulator CheV